jgi:hypothetical protein
VRHTRKSWLFTLLVASTLVLIGCGQQVKPGEVAWKVEKSGEIKTETSGKHDTLVYTFSPHMVVGTDDVAIGPGGELKGPGIYPTIPYPAPTEGGARGLATTPQWKVVPAYCNDGAHVGVYQKRGEKEEDTKYPMLRAPGCHPYPKDHVREVPIGMLQLRSQTPDKLPGEALTGLQICREDPQNYACEASVSGLILNSPDLQVKGILDIDITFWFNTGDDMGKQLWEMGDPKAYTLKLLMNSVRGNRSMVSSVTPDDYVRSDAVEEQIVEMLESTLQARIVGQPVREVKVLVRKRAVTETEMQAQAATHALELQKIEDSQTSLEKQEALDLLVISSTVTVELAQIAADKAIADARNTAETDLRQYSRDQGQQDHTAGVWYLTCIDLIYTMRKFNQEGVQIAGPTNEQMNTAILGCMPPETVAAMQQQPWGTFSLPLPTSPPVTDTGE